jgi:Spy/CpxP family protein refolding chaperone
MKKLLTIALFVFWSATTATAQQPPKPGEDPMAKFFYPPELVMAHQGEIGLSDRQRGAITDIVKDAQGKFLDAQFKMSAATEKLGQIIQGATVDEAKVLEQVDQVLTLEREVKRAQISLLVRIKNQLTAEQQAQLGKLRKQDWTRPPEP